jgi:hypothetical protein
MRPDRTEIRVGMTIEHASTQANISEISFHQMVTKVA